MRALFILAPLAACAAPDMPLGNVAVAPQGFIGFCMVNHDDCAVSSNPFAVPLTDDGMAQLEAVQEDVNLRLTPSPRLPEWGYPIDGRADCNRYALEKRAMLRGLGWPPAALLLTAVKTETGEGHLVLTVTTDHGEWILDNRHHRIGLWSEFDYRIVERQSALNSAEWLTVGVN